MNHNSDPSKPLPSQGSCQTNESGLPIPLCGAADVGRHHSFLPRLGLSGAGADLKILAIETAQPRIAAWPSWKDSLSAYVYRPRIG